MPSTVELVPAGGLSSADVMILTRGLQRSLRRLGDQSGVANEISRRDPDGNDPLLTWEVWLPGATRLVATSTEADLGRAASELDDRMMAQLATLEGKRHQRRVRQARQHREDAR